MKKPRYECPGNELLPSLDTTRVWVEIGKAEVARRMRRAGYEAVEEEEHAGV